MGSIPGSGRSPGGGHGHPFQYFCQENPMERGAWRAIVHRVTKSRTRLKQLSMQGCACPIDFGLASLLTYVSQFLKMSLSIKI